MNAAGGMALGSQESEMYRLGYPYGAWVVRMDPLGLSPVCSLTYFRERPESGDLRALYGNRVLHLSEASPARGGRNPPNHEVVAGAARPLDRRAWCGTNIREPAAKAQPHRGETRPASSGPEGWSARAAPARVLPRRRPSPRRFPPGAQLAGLITS
jgi:hypothetical protein